jgi:hypothetical protein
MTRGPGAADAAGVLRRALTVNLLRAGVAGPILFVAVFLVEGATRPGYDAVRHFVSLLSLGDRGWVQIANFVVAGLLFGAFAAGVARAWTSGHGSRWVPRLIAGVGVGLAVSGVFVADPALGYPPGTPDAIPTSASWHGGIHYLGAAVVFLGLPSAGFIAARRFAAGGRSRLATFSRAAALVVLVGWLAPFTIAQAMGDGVRIAGLLQRLAVAAGFSWVVVLAASIIRDLPVPAARNVGLEAVDA